MKLLKRIVLLSTLLLITNINVKAEETATVTIGYNDINGHVIKEKKDKCIVGRDYTATAITINGYELTTETPKKQTIYCDSEFANNIAFVYQVKANDKEGSVKAYYYDTNGNKISEPDLRSGTPGVDYYITPKDINGYKHVRTEGANNGKFTNGEIIVKFIYQKEGSEEEPKKDDSKKIVTKKQPVKSPSKQTSKKTVKKEEVKINISTSNIEKVNKIVDESTFNNTIINQVKTAFNREYSDNSTNRYYYRIPFYFMCIVNASLIVILKSFFK